MITVLILETVLFNVCTFIHRWKFLQLLLFGEIYLVYMMMSTCAFTQAFYCISFRDKFRLNSYTGHVYTSSLITRLKVFIVLKPL